MAKSATDVAAKWAANLGAATTAIKQGVQGVTASPMAAAAARADAYVAGTQAAVASGKYQAGLNRVSLQDWQNSMLTKGLTRIGPGATAAQPKFASFMSQLLPFQQNALQQLNQTPRGDFNTNVQRMVQWANLMKGFNRQG